VLENAQTRSRFVILHHEVGTKLTRTDQSHYDWMFDVGGTLRTWATEPLVSLEKESDISCDRLSDHRLAYLEREGEIDGDRGRVIRVLAGVFRLTDDRIDRFVAELFWEQGADQRAATVTCYRSLPDVDLRLDESLWRLRFSPGR
jgi:hypothetical protein